MSIYALIKNSIVENIVIWGGIGDLFSDFITVELDDTVTAAIGDAYVNGVIIEKPKDRYDYTLDTSTTSWVITAASATQKRADEVTEANGQKAALLSKAQNTISLWQTELLLGSITDADKANLITWLSYIKALQALDTSTAPIITWPETPSA